MGVNDWKIWHYLGIKKENLLNEVHPIETTESLLEFLNDLHFHQKQLEPIIKDLQELAKEKLTMKKELQGANFAAQSKHFDDLLERYSSLEDDVAINGIRIRRLSQAFLLAAKEAKQKQIVKEKENKLEWKKF